MSEHHEDTARSQDEAPTAHAGEKPGAHQRVVCPFCHSTDVELLSLFGAQLSTDQWYCRSCHTPFERFRGDDE